jgi:hypothetical protein
MTAGGMRQFQENAAFVTAQKAVMADVARNESARTLSKLT